MSAITVTSVDSDEYTLDCDTISTIVDIKFARVLTFSEGGPNLYVTDTLASLHDRLWQSVGEHLIMVADDDYIMLENADTFMSVLEGRDNVHNS